MDKRITRSLLLASGSLALSGGLGAQEADRAVEDYMEAERSKRPNIVVVLADDLGFTDLGAYGGEIHTPNIDRLANSGVKFSNYHTAPSCAPSRAMLLTGVNSHLAGVPNIPEALPPEQEGEENYLGVLNSKVATIASRLNDHGYHTYMTGKWHLGKGEGQLPHDRGFDRTLSMADTGADNYEQKPYLPIYDHAHWTRDGKEVQLDAPFYSSELLIDEMIDYIDSNLDDDQPFFSFVSFMAVHLPVQAPGEFTEKYIGVYDQGWEALRQSRHQSAMDLGLVPPDSGRVTHDFLDSWDDLSIDEQQFAAKRMAVYAGMVEAMDYHFGRLLNYLEESGELDNTIIVFTSDNGPENNIIPDAVLAAQGYSHQYHELGEMGSATYIGPNFANAAASPLSYFKFYMGEGGMRVPMIIAGPGIEARSGFENGAAHVIDITPTLLSLAGVELDGGRFGGRPVEPITGKDLSPLLFGSVAEIRTVDEYVGYEVAGNSALFSGSHKIVMNRAPVGDSQWYLYHIINDPGETIDLKASEPVQFQKMLNMYQRYTKDNGVLAVPAHYIQEQEISRKNILAGLGGNLLSGILTFITLALFAFYGWQRHKGFKGSE